jgi:glycosyltransferase domain-containing protein
MIKIIIPTYNRSAKLKRTIECYAHFDWRQGLPSLIVLDGSTPDHSKLNEQVCKQFTFVEYKYSPEVSFIERIVSYMESVEGDEPICLATDEDVFLPDYLENSLEFLNHEKEYSMLVGRYLTFQKPIGPFHRLSQHRSVLCCFDISQNEFSRRINLLSNALSIGCAPVFWGVRRAGDFLETFKLQSQLYYQSSQEMIDQIILAYQGKIRFVDQPMLLRDETNIEYEITEDRHDSFNYFPSNEAELLINLLREHGGEDLEFAAYVFADKFSLNFVPRGMPSLAIQANNKSYSKYEPIGANITLKNFIQIYFKIFTVLAELIICIFELKKLKHNYGAFVVNNFKIKIKSNQKII